MRVVVRRRVLPEELEDGSIAGEISEEEYRRALKEYEEDGETTLTVEHELSPESARRVLTPRMVELIENLERGGTASISDLARRLGRSIPNVYVDLKYLEELGIVYFRRIGRKAYPILLAGEIRVELNI